jgi:outer membrane protein TolC
MTLFGRNPLAFSLAFAMASASASASPEVFAQAHAPVQVADLHLAQPSRLPVGVMRTLPNRVAARAAIEAHPRVERARGDRLAAHARAGGRQRGPHDWIAGGQWQERDAGNGGRFDEWELSLQRGVRLPGKAALDRNIADLEIGNGEDVLADARHEAALDLLHAWIEWLSANEFSSLAREAAALAGRDLDATALRLDAGHAASAEHDAAVAADARARRVLEEAALREHEARLALTLRYPQLQLPTPAPLIATPGDESVDWEAWAARAATVSHDITLAEGRAELADRRAKRARLDRRADPSIGLRAMSELGGEETVLGVFFSVPLGVGPRRAVAEEETAMAAASWADAEASRIEVTLQARTLARRAALQADAWALASAAAQAQAREAERLAQGHALGGVDLVDLLAARRRANEAAMAEIDARAVAFSSAATLLLDAHAYWIDDGSHAD